MDQNPPKRRGRPPKALNATAKLQDKAKGKGPATKRKPGRQPRITNVSTLLPTSSSTPVASLADYQITLVDVTASYKDGFFTISGLRRGMLDVEPWSADGDDPEESPPLTKRTMDEGNAKETLRSRSDSKRRRVSSDSDSDVSFGEGHAKIPSRFQNLLAAEQGAGVEKRDQVLSLTKHGNNVTSASFQYGESSPGVVQAEESLPHNVAQEPSTSMSTGQPDPLVPHHVLSQQTPSSEPLQTGNQDVAGIQFLAPAKLVPNKEGNVLLTTLQGIEKPSEGPKDGEEWRSTIDGGRGNEQTTKLLQSVGFETTPGVTEGTQAILEKPFNDVPTNDWTTNALSGSGLEVFQQAFTDAYRKYANIPSVAREEADEHQMVPHAQRVEERIGPVGSEDSQRQSGDTRLMPEDLRDGGREQAHHTEEAMEGLSVHVSDYHSDTRTIPVETDSGDKSRSLPIQMVEPTNNVPQPEVSREVDSTPGAEIIRSPLDATVLDQTRRESDIKAFTQEQATRVEEAVTEENSDGVELSTASRPAIRAQPIAESHIISDDETIPEEGFAMEVEEVDARGTVPREYVIEEQADTEQEDSMPRKSSLDKETTLKEQTVEDWKIPDDGNSINADQKSSRPQSPRHGRNFPDVKLNLDGQPHVEQHVSKSNSERTPNEEAIGNAPQVPELDMADAAEDVFERLSKTVEQTLLHEPQSPISFGEGDGGVEAVEVGTESAQDSGEHTPQSVVDLATPHQSTQHESAPASKECPICAVDYTTLSFKDFEQHVAKCVEDEEAQYSELSDEEHMVPQTQSPTRLGLASTDMGSPCSDSQRTVSEPPPFGGDDSEMDLPGPYDEDDEWESLYEEDAETSLGNNAERKLPKFKKLTDPELFWPSIMNPETLSTPVLIHNVENAIATLAAWQAEYIALDEKVAKATHRRPQNPRARLDPVVFEDQKEADLYGYKWDPNPKKRGMQDPIGQRLGRLVGGRELRRRAPALKTQPLDSDVGAQEGFRRTRGKRNEGVSEVNGLSMRSEGLMDADTPEQSDAPKKRGRPRLNPLPVRIQNIRDEDILSGTSTESEGTPAPNAKRRGRPPKEAQPSKAPTKRTPRANPWASQHTKEQDKAKEGDEDRSEIVDPLLQPAYGVQKKPKSLKRSNAMTLWWAKRKSEQAALAEAAAAAAEGSDADIVKGRVLEKPLPGSNSTKATKTGLTSKNGTPIPQKRRGRPPKQSSLGAPVTTETDETSSQPKRRGRPPGAPNKAPRTKSTLAMAMDGTYEGHDLTQTSEVLNHASPYQQSQEIAGNSSLGRRRRHGSAGPSNRGTKTPPYGFGSDSDAIRIVESSEDADDDGDDSYYGN